MFTEQIKLLATDKEIRILQNELISKPDKGDLIKGTGGLRKIRMAVGNKGKSGGTRVIYFLGTSIDTVKSWELKRRNPTGLTAKVLIAIHKNPNLFKELASI